MEITMRKVSELTPYAKNAKTHDKVQIDNVAQSIKELGWLQPIVIDRDGVVVVGHCRLLAAKKLKQKEVPCLIADELTDEQIKKYRVLDNKLNESPWDLHLLAEDVEGLDFSGYEVDFGIGEAATWFDQRDRWDDSTEGEDDEYKEFLNKFEQKKTTDDCYTPDNIYEAVANWCASEYGVKRELFVRPFFPGGDYQKHKYPAGCVVVDNPPFSIMAEILRFYCEKGIKFLLFAPTLTLFSGRGLPVTYIPTACGITYENGACVNTSFITNMDKAQIRTSPALYEVVTAANDENLAAMHKELPKYEYPDHVVTAAMVSRWSRYGVEWSVGAEQCERIAQLDAQKDEDKAIFGGGFILSDRAAKEKAAAEKAAAEKAAAEKAAAEKAAAMKWRLSERELAIVEKLNAREAHGDV